MSVFVCVHACFNVFKFIGSCVDDWWGGGIVGRRVFFFFFFYDALPETREISLVYIPDTRQSLNPTQLLQLPLARNNNTKHDAFPDHHGDYYCLRKSFTILTLWTYIMYNHIVDVRMI